MNLIAWIKRHADPLTTGCNIICLILLTGQCVRSAIEYFEYSVYYRVAAYTPMELTVPLLSLCIPISTLLDMKGGKDFFTTNENSAAGKTLGNLYSLAPPSNSTVVECRVRQFEINRMVRLDRDECEKFFNILVYRFYGYVCYRFTPIRRSYTIYSVVNTFTHRRVLYRLVIDEPLNLGYKLLPIIHIYGFPEIDRFWDQELLPSDSKNESYTLSQNMFEMHRLPPPYETKCGAHSHHFCYTECIHNATRHYGFSAVGNVPHLDDASLLFPSNEITYRGKHLNEVYEMNEGMCKDRCRGVTSCNQKFVQTIISSPDESPHKLIFDVEIVSQPVTRLTTGANFTLIDFIFTCATLCSIWVGFSVLRLFELGHTSLTHEVRESRLQQMTRKCEETLEIKKKIEFTFRRYCLSLTRFTRLSRDDSKNKGLLHYKPGTKKLIIGISLLVKLVLLIGFLWQTISISETYFKFSTGTQLSFDVNPVIEAPTMAVCIRYDIMAGGNDLTSVTQENQNRLFLASDVHFDITVEEVFNNSWPSEKMIQSCRTRRRSENKSWIMQLHSRQKCQTHFTGKRFFFDRNICYALKLKNTIPGTQVAYREIMSDPGIFYSLVLSKSATSGDKMFIMLYSNDQQLPLESKSFLATIYMSGEKRLFLVSLSSLRKESLAYPYEDRCVENTSRAACLRLCMRKRSLERLNRLPFSDIFADDEIVKDALFDKKVIRYVDLNNTRAMEIWTETENECYSKCLYEQCNETVFNTLVNFGFRSEHRVELAVEEHSSPDVVRRSIPQLTFFEYSYQFFATAAFWFAFSVVSTNPVTALVKRDKNSKTQTLMKKLKRVKKTTAELRNLIISLNQLFGMRLMHHTLKRKKRSRWFDCFHWFFEEDVSKFYSLLKCLCAIGCAIHLSAAFGDYLSYPILMKTLSDAEQVSCRPLDLSVCLHTKDLLRMNGTLNLPKCTGSIEQDDEFAQISIKKIFESTPRARDLLVACGYRGIRNSSLKALTNRVYLLNYNDSQLCNNIFTGDKFLLEANTCYKYGERMSVDNSGFDPAHLINLRENILTIMINSSYMTHEFFVTVSEREHVPSYSGLWAPTITKKGSSVWMAISYIKIIRNVLDHPFGNDGFTGGSHVGCMSRCLNEYLKPLGVRDPGIIRRRPRDNTRYLSSSDLDEPVIRESFQRYQNSCKNYCLNYNVHRSSRIITFITRMSGWKHEDNPVAANKTQLHLTRTEYPVITITFLPKQTLPEFFIILGSILGIWFGLSAVHFDPLRYLKKDSNVSPNQLARCETELELVSKTIRQLYCFFFACKN